MRAQMRQTADSRLPGQFEQAGSHWCLLAAPQEQTSDIVCYF